MPGDMHVPGVEEFRAALKARVAQLEADVLADYQQSFRELEDVTPTTLFKRPSNNGLPAHRNLGSIASISSVTLPSRPSSFYSPMPVAPQGSPSGAPEHFRFAVPSAELPLTVEDLSRSQGASSPTEPPASAMSMLSDAHAPASAMSMPTFPSRAMSLLSGSPLPTRRSSMLNAMQDHERIYDVSFQKAWARKMSRASNKPPMAPGPMKNSTGNPDEAFSMLPTIVPFNVDHKRKTCRVSHFLNEEGGGDDDEQGEDQDLSVEYGCLLKNGLILPHSAFRTCWLHAGTVMVIYDMIAIPLQFLDLARTTFTQIMLFVSCFYWSLDMAFSFGTAVQLPNGRLQLKRWQVSKIYLSSWFTFDMFLISLDLLELFSESAGVSSLRIWKGLKSIRILRMARLVKVVQRSTLPDWAFHVIYRLHSEAFAIILSIMKLTLAVAWATHFVACCWYAIGLQGADKMSWLTEHDLLDAGVSYTYATAFHWSLTQLTGSMEIAPVTLLERSFADVALFIGFLVGAGAVSSLAASMTRLHMITAQEAKNTAALRTYLIDNEISSRLAIRVQRHAQDAAILEKKNTPESSIKLLELLSEPLRVELHYEIYEPVLKAHPFFEKLNNFDRQAFRRICHSMKKNCYTRGDVIFCAGEVVTDIALHFITSGYLQYIQLTEKDEHIVLGVHKGMWVCEPVLWTTWVHQGDMQTTTECTFLDIEQPIFHHIMMRSLINSSGDSPLISYAKGFVKALNSVCREDLTDLDSTDVNVWWLVNEAFPTDRFSTVDGAHMIRPSIHRALSKRFAGPMRAMSNRSMGAVDNF